MKARKKIEIIEVMQIDFTNPNCIKELMDTVGRICNFWIVYHFGNKYPYLEIVNEGETLSFNQEDYLAYDSDKCKFKRYNKEQFEREWEII